MGATTWTDPTITAGSTPIRKVHIDELRAAINRWRQFYGLAPASLSATLPARSRQPAPVPSAHEGRRAAGSQPQREATPHVPGSPPGR